MMWDVWHVLNLTSEYNSAGFVASRGSVKAFRVLGLGYFSGRTVAMLGFKKHTLSRAPPQTVNPEQQRMQVKQAQGTVRPGHFNTNE